MDQVEIVLGSDESAVTLVELLSSSAWKRIGWCGECRAVILATGHRQVLLITNSRLTHRDNVVRSDCSSAIASAELRRVHSVLSAEVAAELREIEESVTRDDSSDVGVWVDQQSVAPFVQSSAAYPVGDGAVPLVFTTHTGRRRRTVHYHGRCGRPGGEIGIDSRLCMRWV